MDASITSRDRGAMKRHGPALLLVEDDATSRAFLGAALRRLPMRVATARDAAGALRAVARRPFDLWLLDAHLPDADGAVLLQALRARVPGTPALAHTATPGDAAIAALLAAGFAGVVQKPIGVAALQAAVGDALHAARGVAEPAPARWNEPAALAAMNGRISSVAALRGLFRAELPGQRDAIVSALDAGNRLAAAAVLHRLRAACGFVGAQALAEAVLALQADPGAWDALRRLESCVAALLSGNSPLG